MNKYHFKMYYLASSPGEDFEVFFEAFFEAGSVKEAQHFGSQLAKLYSDNGMPTKSHAIRSHNITQLN